jgi:hypothetical protein
MTPLLRRVSQGQNFHERVLPMTFWKPFDRGDDAIAELVIEIWRLKVA